MKNWLRSVWRSAFTRGAKIAGYDIGTWAALGGMSLAIASSGMTVTRDSAFKVAAYKRGVQLIADYIGKTPFHVKAGHERATNHPAWHLVRKWARWHELSAFEFRRVLVIHALTTGNGYGWIERDAGMRPINLHILDPRKISPKLVNGRTVYRIDGKDTYFEPHEIIHIRGMSVDGFSGMDPIATYGTEVLGLAMAQQQYASTYYANGGIPSTYLRTDEYLDDEQWARVQSSTGPLKRAVDNPHEIPVLEKADLKSVNLSAEQTQLLGAREFSLKDIANLLGLPVHKLQGTGNSSYKSLEEENRSFRDDTLDPWLCQFEMEYTKLLTEDQQLTDSYDVEAVRESLTRTNMKDRADILFKNVGGPLMTPNEGREILSLPPIEGGDELLKPANMTPQASGAADGTDPAEDPASDAGTDQARAAFDAHCKAALADVAARMLKRLSVQSERTKDDTWPEFLASLEEKHGEVIRSAFAPLVPLCGGDSTRLSEASERVFKAVRSAGPGLAVSVPADVLAADVLHIIRSRT
jgi:HK97 family phage portal protein